MTILNIFASLFLIICAIFNINKILDPAKIMGNKKIMGFLNFYAISVGLYVLWAGFN